MRTSISVLSVLLLIAGIGFAGAQTAERIIPADTMPLPAGEQPAGDAFGDLLFEIDVASIVGDYNILGAAYVDPYIYVNGGASGTDPNYVYILDTDFNQVGAFQQSTSNWGWFDIAWDGSYFYGGEWGNNTITVFQTDGTVVDTLAGPLSDHWGVGVDPSTGHLWLSSSSSGTNIVEYEIGTGIVNSFSNSYEVWALAWDDVSPDGPWLWVTTNTPDVLRQFDPVGGVYTGVEIALTWSDNAPSGLEITGDWPLTDAGMGIFIGAIQEGYYDVIYGVELFECTGCLIEDNCWDDEETNPENVCLICDIEQSTEQWSYNDGANCGDDLFCNGTDICNTGECEHSGDPCGDDGMFCTGAESCDEENDECVSSGNPCPDDGLWCTGNEACDEINDQCVSEYGEAMPRCPDDGLWCTGAESCDEENDRCVSEYDESNPRCPDDGAFCNGDEVCDDNADACASTGDPCADDLFCNGEDTCDEDQDACSHSGDPCGDDGEFCNGEESCDEETDACVSSGDPCDPDGEICNEETDSCDVDEGADDEGGDDEDEGTLSGGCSC